MDFILRAILSFGVILLAHYLYPIILGFTQALTTFEGKLFGFIPLSWLNNQLIQGMVFLMLCLWFGTYAFGFADEVKIARFRSPLVILVCACQWGTAMTFWALLILGEPVLVYMLLSFSPLPQWLVWVIALLFFCWSILFGFAYPARTVLHLREKYGRDFFDED